MLSGALLVKQTIILCFVLNFIFVVKPITQSRGYAAVSTTTKVCPIGYIGLNCLLRCRYPAFGYLCQNKCNCKQSRCNHSTGCESCRIGLFGPNCKRECRFPSFGFQCQQNCSCEENRCDHKEGCIYNLTTNKMVTNTLFTLTYKQDELEYTKTPVQNVDHTFSSQDDIMVKLIDENKHVLISTIIIALAIFALILLGVYVSTFAVAPCPQRI